MQEWRNNAVSITKYNPKFRNTEGHYTKEDWISFSDIGSIYDNKKLTIERYLQVENKYIPSAILIAELFNNQTFEIREIEKYKINKKAYQTSERNNIIKLFEKLRNNTSVDLFALKNIIIMILRGDLYCEIVLDKKTKTILRFGYDYYMYINSDKDLQNVFEKIKEIGLYVW